MKLPALPQHDYIGANFRHRTDDQIRAIQREAAIWALEEAEKVCDGWKRKNWMYVNGAIRCGADIRALKGEIE